MSVRGLGGGGRIHTVAKTAWMSFLPSFAFVWCGGVKNVPFGVI